MRKTIIAASAAAVLAVSGACGSDDNGVDEATDAVTSEVDNMMEGENGEGADSEAESGSESGAESGSESGADVEMSTLALDDGTEVDVPSGIAQKYEEIQGTTDHLGNPVGETEEVAGGHMVEFEGGSLIQNPDGEAFLVQGVILEEYTANGGPEGELGFPTSDEMADEAGFTSTFENGTIMFDLATEQATVEMN